MEFKQRHLPQIYLKNFKALNFYLLTFKNDSRIQSQAVREEWLSSPPPKKNCTQILSIKWSKGNGCFFINWTVDMCRAAFDPF